MSVGAIMMSCAILLHPTGEEPKYHTTVIRVNKYTPDKCRIAAGKFNAKTGKNVCTCEKVRHYPIVAPLTPPSKDKP